MEGFGQTGNDADPRHLSVDGAQARQHGRAQPPVRYRSLDARRPFGRDRRTGQIVIRTDRGSRWGFSRSIT